MPNAALIFAAGLGTRMGHLTHDKPKPLIQVAGRALLDHALDPTRAAGIENVVMNTHYKSEMISAHLMGQNIAISDESDEILETGGGLRKALPLLGEGPVFTMNSDAVWAGPNPYSALRAAWNPTVMSALLLCVGPSNTFGRTGSGDFTIAPDSRLIRKGSLTYTGVQIVDPMGLEKIVETVFSMNLLWNLYAEQGRLFGVTYSGNWCDVGRPEGVSSAEKMIGYGQDV